MIGIFVPFCLPGLGAADLRLEAGLDLRLLLGLALLPCPPGCFSCLAPAAPAPGTAEKGC